MRVKRCKHCGQDFETDRQGAYLCPSCSLAARQGSVIRPRTCRQCGAVFDGGPRAWYCPSCRAGRALAAGREYKRRGPARPLGSIDHCQRCGTAYIVEGGRQQYCKACAPFAVREITRSQKRAYNAEHRETLSANKAAMRTQSKVCLNCGKTFDSRGPSVTCSDACAKLLKRRRMEAAEYKRGRRQSPPSVYHDSGLPKSGVLGVTARYNGKWQATHKGKYLGVFDTIGLAAQAIEAHKKELSP